MPSEQRVRRHDRVQLEKCLASDRLRFPRKKSPFSIGEPKPFASQLLFQQPILGLEEFDDRQLMPVNPARGHHEQE